MQLFQYFLGARIARTPRAAGEECKHFRLQRTDDANCDRDWPAHSEFFRGIKPVSGSLLVKPSPDLGMEGRRGPRTMTAKTTNDSKAHQNGRTTMQISTLQWVGRGLLVSVGLSLTAVALHAEDGEDNNRL